MQWLDPQVRQGFWIPDQWSAAEDRIEKSLGREGCTPARSPNALQQPIVRSRGTIGRSPPLSSVMIRLVGQNVGTVRHRERPELPRELILDGQVALARGRTLASCYDRPTPIDRTEEWVENRYRYLWDRFPPPDFGPDPINREAHVHYTLRTPHRFSISPRRVCLRLMTGNAGRSDRC